MSLLDWLVLCAYFLIVAVIGVLSSLKVKGTQAYFLGHRRFSPWVMVGQSLSVGTHPEMIVAVSGAVYTSGASAIWYQWKNLFATPFYWIMAPVFRRSRRTTTAELVEDRFGAQMAAIYTVFALSYFTITTATLLKGAGKVVNQALGGEVGANQVVIAMTAIFVLYSFAGGLVATAWNMLVQGVLIVTLSFLLIPLGWPLVGGMREMKSLLPADRFSVVTPAGIDLWTIVMLTLNGLIGIMAMPHVMASVGTGRDEISCRRGFFYGNLVKRFCTVGWTIVGLLVAALVAKGTFGVYSLADPEDAFGFAARHLLFPGLLGLLIACVLAAGMAACSAFMVDAGALFTQSLYRRYLVTGATDGHYLWVGRVSGLSVTLLAVLYALFLIDRVLYSFLLTETMATYIGISIVGGLIWQRANRWGAIASLAAAFSTNFLLYHLQDRRLDAWDPNVFLFSLSAGVGALVLFSLLSRPEPEATTRDFLERLELSSDGGANGITEQNRQPLLLVSLLGLRQAARPVGIYRRFRVEWLGLLQGFLLVFALVGLTWMILRR
ncbi:MAG: sodium:solute symporter [Acidobacteriota bacterium]